LERSLGRRKLAGKLRSRGEERVQKVATKLFGRMPPNCSICKNAVQQQEIEVIEGRKLGGHGQDMGQRAIGRRNFIFALQKSKNC
jgi:hypothetical protein